MRPPIFVRPLTAAERQQVEAGLRSAVAVVLRRSQIVRASARGEPVRRIARQLGCGEQTIRNTIHAFNATGSAALQPGSSRPRVVRVAFDPERAEQLRALLHQSPRTFGRPTGLWTLALAAEVSFEHGLTTTRVSAETIRMTLKRLGIGWRRAKRWITSPDPAYARRKGARDRLIRLALGHPDWALGFADETWWSRLARPALRSWAEPDRPLRLVEQTVAKGEPKALACYGLLVRWWERPDRLRHEEAWLRFVDGRPVSGLTTRFLAWCCAKLEAAGKAALLLVWDNASWHVSRAVRAWIRQHNRAVKRARCGVRIINGYLPIKAPWLNPIEPKWVHSKRRVIEPARLLPASELIERVCAAFDCPLTDRLAVR
jgi:transposase